MRFFLIALIIGFKGLSQTPAQISSCLSGTQLSDYNSAVSNQMIEITASQFFCISNLNGVNAIGAPVGEILTNNTFGPSFTGNYTEIYENTNSEGYQVEIPVDQVILAFAFVNNTSANNTVGPRQASGSLPWLNITQPATADLTVTGIGSKYFLIKQPTNFYTVVTRLGIRRTNSVYSPNLSGGQNYAYVEGGPTGTINMKSCNCNTPFIAALIADYNQISLPIELTSFNAEKLEHHQIRIRWTTESERNNAYFELEKSMDTQQWTVIDTQTGAGNSSEILHYQFIDSHPFPNTNYYRLKQIDFNGSTTYSEVIQAEGDDTPLIFPNPSDRFVHIHVKNKPNDLKLLNSLGSEMAVSFEYFENDAILVLDVNELAEGYYFIKIAGKCHAFIKN